MKQWIFWLAALFIIPLMQPAKAQTNASQCNLSNGLALEGYDPVSYFQGKPEKGKPAYMYKADGITYYFINAGNRDAFRKNPAAYQPQYGGWCAYAMGKTGEKVAVDPETFKIINGKLYLFYNKYFNNTLKSWNKDEKNLKPAADAHWMKYK